MTDKSGQLFSEEEEMKVYCVLDDSEYPQKLHSIFAQKKDAYDFALSLNIYVVEEYEVIE